MRVTGHGRKGTKGRGSVALLAAIGGASGQAENER